MSAPGVQKEMHLPEPTHDGSVSLEHTLFQRRSVRRYKKEPLTPREISQLLWAAQGVTNARGYRTAPSAGALFPLEVYLAAGWVTDLPAGIYKYNCRRHTLNRIVDEDKRGELCRAALNQRSIASAPAVLLICAVFERITRKYGQRGIQYTFIEIGHAAQNACLQAVAMGLGTVVIGAFRKNEIKMIANLAEDEQPAYMIPVGWK
jgi:SagB-type dehydrogenase family enzyme